MMMKSLCILIAVVITHIFSCDGMPSNHAYSLYQGQFPGFDTALKLCKKPLRKRGEGETG